MIRPPFYSGKEHNDALAHDPIHYLYVIIRKDIPAPQQTVQIAHATYEAGSAFLRPSTPIHMVILEIDNIAALHSFARTLLYYNIPHYIFWEPDDGLGDTVLCTAPIRGSARKHFKSLAYWTPPK